MIESSLSPAFKDPSHSPRSSSLILASATSSTFFPDEVIKHGFLDKRGQSLMASWQTRWFVLTSTQLSYYTDNKLTQQKGSLQLNYSCLVTRKPSEGSHKHLLNVYDKQNGRNLLLCASDTITLTSWETAISDVINYLNHQHQEKLQQQQLQQQQNQDNEDNNSNSTSSGSNNNNNNNNNLIIKDIYYEDYLYKDGGTNVVGHTWTKRWCVLTKCTIAYFTDQKKTTLKGVFILDENSFIIRRKPLNSDKQFLLGLYLDTPTTGPGLSGSSGGTGGSGGLVNSTDRSQRLLSASSEELLLTWYKNINHVITQLKHTNNLIVIRVFICNEYNTPFIANTTDTIYSVKTYVNNQVLKTEYHHYNDLRVIFKHLSQYLTEKPFENQFPRQYKRNTFGVQLSDDETEKRRLQLELWLQELFDKYNQYLLLNDIDLLRRITSVFGYTPLAFNDLLNSVKNCDSDDESADNDDNDNDNDNNGTGTGTGAGSGTTSDNSSHPSRKRSIPRVLLLSESSPRRDSVVEIDETIQETSLQQQHSIQLPEKSSELKSYSLYKLALLCLQKHVDCSLFTSRKHYIKALTKTYTPSLPYLHGKQVRLHINKLLQLIEQKKSYDPHVMNEIENIFVDYCKKFQNIKDNRIKLLLIEYTVEEKLDIIRKCISIWDKEINFTVEDMIMLEQFHGMESLDIFYILTLQHRVNSSSSANNWLERFCSSHGLTILVQKLTHLTEFKPLLSYAALSIYLILEIFRVIIQSDCRYLLIATSSFISSLYQTLYLSSQYYDIIYEIFELFSEILIYGGTYALEQMIIYSKTIARLYSEKPFQRIVEIYSNCDVMIQSSIVSYINSLLIYCPHNGEKIQIRNYLLDLQFDQITTKYVKEYAKFIGNPIVSNQNNEEQSAPPLPYDPKGDRDKDRDREEGQGQGEGEGEQEEKLTYSKQLRPGISVCDQDCQENFADDDATLINPEIGHMEGCALEILVNMNQIDETDIVGGVGGGVGGVAGAVPPNQGVVEGAVGNISSFFSDRLSFRGRSSSAMNTPTPATPTIQVKRYWYQLKGHILSWYHEITGTKVNPSTPPIGSIDFRSVIDILDYSLLPAHVNLCFQHCFTIISHPTRQTPLILPLAHTSNKKLHYKDLCYSHVCVDNIQMKHQWLYAFAVVRNYLQLKRSPVFIPNPHSITYQNQTVSSATLYLLKKNFENLVNIYRSVTKEDLNSLYLNEIHEFVDTTTSDIIKSTQFISFSLQDFIQFLHYELRTHKNEEKFILLMKELGDYVIKNYAPKPVLVEEEINGKNYPLAVPSSERPVPSAPSLPPLPPNKPVIKPNIKVKQLFWTVIKPVNVYKTIWMGMEEVAIPWATFDQLFTATQSKKIVNQNLSSSGSGSGSGSGSTKSKQKQVVTLFDARRTQNVAIACGKLRKSPEEIYDLVVMLEPEELTLEMNDTILNLLLPTADEINLVKNYIMTNMKLYENTKLSAKSEQRVEKSTAGGGGNGGAEERKEREKEEVKEISTAVPTEMTTIRECSEKENNENEKKGETEETLTSTTTTTTTTAPESVSSDTTLPNNTNKGDEQPSSSLSTETVITPDPPTPEKDPNELIELELINDLDYCGKLFAYFMNIDRLESRLKCHKIILSWNDEVSIVYEQLTTVQQALNEINSEHSLTSFKLILSTLLTIGNYMNGLTKRGQAHGYRLEILMKLKLIKQHESGRKHLLHYLISYLNEFYSQYNYFYSNWSAVWLTNKINMNNLEILLKEIKNSIEICSKEIELVEEMTNEQIRRPLLEKLVQFTTYANDRYQLLIEQFEDTCQAVNNLKRYLGETVLGTNTSNPEEDPWQTFFQFLIRFSEMYKICVQELKDWEQQEKRMKNKLNLTVAGKMSGIQRNPRKSVSPLVDENLAKENEKLKNIEKQKMIRPSLKINSQLAIQNGLNLDEKEKEGNDVMKLFKEQIKSLRNNRKEIKKINNEDSDGDGDEEDED